MTSSQLIAFNLALLAAILSPGPALIYAIKSNLSGGRAAGISAGLGLATMAAGWTLMALLGLGGLFRLFPALYVTVKVIGALYLLYVAWSMWRDAATPLETSGVRRQSALAGGVLVNLANPKSVLFASAVLVVVFPVTLSGTQMALIVANHWLVEVLVYSGLSLLLSSRAVANRYLRAKPVIERGCALLLGALGLRLLIERD